MAQKKAASRYIQFYTPDSTARKVEVQLVDERQWAPLPEYKVRRKKVIRIDPVAIIGILTAVFLMAAMLFGVNSLVQIREEAAQIELQVASLQAENRILSQKYADGYDLAAVEREALAMGMVPVEQAQQITIHVSQPAEQSPQTLTLWEQITTFLAGIFA